MYAFGVMLSHWQGRPDFNKLSKAGCSFINQKATDGTEFVDNTLARNVGEARKYGMGVMLFHFYQPVNIDQQLRLFLNTVDALKPDLLQFDWERDNPNPAACVQDAIYFLKGCREAYKRIPVLYTNPDQLNRHFYSGTEQLTGNLLDIAQYNVGFPCSHVPFIGWDIWQQTPSARVSGITGSVPIEVTHYKWSDLISFATGV